MYFVSATRLRLKSVWLLPAFMRANEASIKELIRTEGFVSGKELMDKGLTFWTLTAWHTDAGMKTFRNSPAHREAMRRLPDWCCEATYLHWLQEDATLPSWQKVHEKICTDGLVTKVRNPTPIHTGKDFPSPKWLRTERHFTPAK